MNEIEKAIKILEIIEVLKDTQNEKGCDYCKKTKSLYEGENQGEINEIYIEQDGSLSFSYWFGEDGIGENFPIKYCPMCGRCLDKKGIESEVKQ